MNRRTVYAFDFDGTLFDGDSFVKFALFSLGRLKFIRALILESPWLVAWRLLHAVSSSKAKERLFRRLYRGMPLSEFNRLGQEFQRVIDGHIRAEVAGEMRSALLSGARVYIISASLENWIIPWAKAQGDVKVLATRAGVDDKGCLTGRFDGPNCIGREKVTRLLEAEPGRQGYTLVAYGDSGGDRDLMAIADRQVWV